MIRNRNLKQRADLIVHQHPNLIKKLFSNLRRDLPLGFGEGKIKDGLAENIPEWIYDLTEDDLKEFIDTLLLDPEFFRYLKFLILELENYIYED
jgi:hypothetical protein